MKSPQDEFDAALSDFPSGIQSDLRSELASHGFIASKRVAAWLAKLGIGAGTLMIRLLPVAAAWARAPISKCRIGAVALGMAPEGNSKNGPGALYFGANMEFPEQALSFGVHGEQSAVNNAWLNGETGLQSLAINAAPCGYCRQFLYELTTARKGFQVLRRNSDAAEDWSYTAKTVAELLPRPFGPRDLGVKGGLMRKESHELSISGTDQLVQAALDAANESYAPYTGDFCGVALTDRQGTMYSGRCAENAAFNPSLSPLQSALSLMSMKLAPGAVLDVDQVVLVEAEERKDVSQRGVTEAILSSCYSGVQLQYVEASGNASD